MTVGDGCSLYLGSTGTSMRTGVEPSPGTFDMNHLTVANGGEITYASDVTDKSITVNVGFGLLIYISMYFAVFKKHLRPLLTWKMLGLRKYSYMTSVIYLSS